ncbi:MAG: PAS domain S-box protein, partial [Solirubrobacteraceae bacterium]
MHRRDDGGVVRTRAAALPAEVYSNVAGYLSRALTFFLLGGLLGLYVDRLRQVDRAARRLAAIVEQTDDGVVVCAPDGTITEWNDGAARLFGYGAAEAVGAHVGILAAPEQAAEHREIATKVLGGDLREPLRSVGGFAELLEQRYGDQLAGDGSRFLGFVREGVVRMQSMISDLLSYSRAGQARLRSEPTDVNELIRETLFSLDAAVRDAGADVHVSQLPTVVADRAALAQVFGNLLSNALTFHDREAPVRVEVSAEP